MAKHGNIAALNSKDFLPVGSFFDELVEGALCDEVLNCEWLLPCPKRGWVGRCVGYLW